MGKEWTAEELEKEVRRLMGEKPASPHIMCGSARMMYLEKEHTTEPRYRLSSLRVNRHAEIWCAAWRSGLYLLKVRSQVHGQGQQVQHALPSRTDWSGACPVL